MSISVIENHMYNIKQAIRISNLLSWDPKEVFEFHRSIGNKETPLIKLPSLANHLGIGSILIKDESHRFGLNAFKVLGASYAMHRLIKKFPQINTFCTASDGNHGRAVAWMAKKLERKAIIYMPKGTVLDRINAIKEEGAEVFVIDDSYDVAVKIANEKVLEGNQQKNNLWSLVQDTAWDGYEEIPLDIMRGYWTQMHEISNQIGKEKIDVVFLQIGVGSWAASIISYAMSQWENPPIFISVEPYSANCLFESIRTGRRVSVKNNQTTMMAGLNCGTVSTKAWDILKNGIVGSISISDKLSEQGMKVLANPLSEDSYIIGGESGASGLSALIGLCRRNNYSEFKKKFSLNKKSTILVINTEGDTDSNNYKKIIKEIENQN